jgi:hypothetical protein
VPLPGVDYCISRLLTNNCLAIHCAVIRCPVCPFLAVAAEGSRGSRRGEIWPPLWGCRRIVGRVVGQLSTRITLVRLVMAAPWAGGWRVHSWLSPLLPGPGAQSRAGLRSCQATGGAGPWTLIEAFETLASQKVKLASHAVASFDGLIHPAHQCGRVFGWQLAPHDD